MEELVQADRVPVFVEVPPTPESGDVPHRTPPEVGDGERGELERLAVLAQAPG